MTAGGGDQTRLDWLYRAALAFHALVLVGLGYLAVATALGPRMADSAPDFGMSGVLMWAFQTMGLFLVGIISIVVWMSRWFAHRLGQAPSPGHKKLAVAGTVPYLAGAAYVVML